MFKMASDSELLTDDCRLLTLRDNCDTDYRNAPTLYREKPMGIDARVMAWQTAPQNVGIWA